MNTSQITEERPFMFERAFDKAAARHGKTLLPKYPKLSGPAMKFNELVRSIINPDGIGLSNDFIAEKVETRIDLFPDILENADADILFQWLAMYDNMFIFWAGYQLEQFENERLLRVLKRFRQILDEDKDFQSQKMALMCFDDSEWWKTKRLNRQGIYLWRDVR